MYMYILYAQLCNYNSQWLKETFLGYLKEWEVSVEKRPGYSRLMKMMLLSPETLLGLKITGVSDVNTTCNYVLF